MAQLTMPQGPTLPEVGESCLDLSSMIAALVEFEKVTGKEKAETEGILHQLARMVIKHEIVLIERSLTSMQKPPA